MSDRPDERVYTVAELSLTPLSEEGKRRLEEIAQSNQPTPWEPSYYELTAAIGLDNDPRIDALLRWAAEEIARLRDMVEYREACAKDE